METLLQIFKNLIVLYINMKTKDKAKHLLKEKDFNLYTIITVVKLF